VKFKVRGNAVKYFLREIGLVRKAK
jgi:hypothetical protein